jgi:hypothetical protein
MPVTALQQDWAAALGFDAEIILTVRNLPAR